jgi:hypothetical protein
MDRVKNEVLHAVKDERSILHTSQRKKKANWIGHNLRMNCLPKNVTEGKIYGTRIRGRRRKQLLGDIKEEKGTGT